MFRKNVLPVLLIGAMSTAALAGSTVELTDANAAKVREVLTEQGYDVAKIKKEDGLYEAYARKDGKKFEIYLDAEFSVVDTELDD